MEGDIVVMLGVLVVMFIVGVLFVGLIVGVCVGLINGEYIFNLILE